MAGNVHVAWGDFTDYAGCGTDTDVFYKMFEAPTVEPTALRDIVEFPGTAHLKDLYGEDKAAKLSEIINNVTGFSDVKDHLKAKGYIFDVASANVSLVNVEIANMTYSGAVLSWWSREGPNGTRAFLAAAEMGFSGDIVFGITTNLLSPEQVPGLDPYIIVNAMPYVYVEWHWWYSGTSRIVSWKYWWYDSHSHPNWLWNCYWWWRTYLKHYYLRPFIAPWWWWFWHWTCWKHWYWWSTEFPYS